MNLRDERDCRFPADVASKHGLVLEGPGLAVGTVGDDLALPDVRTARRD